MDVQIFRLRVLELFDYDREAGKLYWKISRHGIRVGQEAGSINNKDGYRYVMIDGKKYLTHRLIFLIEHGYLPDCLDHKDGNRLNNRIENLRPCSLRENSRNASKKSNNTSGVVGVYWNKAKKKWHAQCADRTGKQAHLGYFENKHFAGEAVRRFSLEHHQEFTKPHWNPVDETAFAFLATKLKASI